MTDFTRRFSRNTKVSRTGQILVSRPEPVDCRTMDFPPAAFTGLLRARSREDLLQQSVRFARAMDFDHIGVMTVVDHPEGPDFANLSTVPYVDDESHDDEGSRRADPVMQHSRNSNAPLVWSQDTYVRAGQGPMWEVQAKFGLKAGVIWALHLPKGRHVVIGLDRDRPLTSADIKRTVPALQLFTAMAAEASLELLPASSTRAAPPDLAPRELEALRWLTQGAPVETLSTRLGLTVETAKHCVRDILRKLDCHHEAHASLKALRLGLIT